MAAVLAQRVLLEIHDVHLAFGGVVALAGVTLGVNPGEIYSIIGPNGAGKTTMLNAISGVFRPTRGRIVFDGHDCARMRTHRLAEVGIARTFQNLALFRDMSVEENVLVGRHALMRSGVLECGIHFGRARGEEKRHRAAVAAILEFLGLAAVAHEPADRLPYGLQKRVELGRALAVEPKLLLLDEPMAGMNHGEKAELMRLVTELNRARGITIILIEHDMGVVMSLSHRVAVLDHGVKIAEGAPAEVSADERVIRAYLGSDDESEGAGVSELMFGIELTITGMLIGLMYSMVALGFVLIYKASSVFNFAQGAMTLFAALTVVGLIPHFGFIGAVAVTAVVMCVVAVGAERIVFRPLMGTSQLTIFMGTVGFASILEGAAQIIWGTKPRGLKLGIPSEPLKLGDVFVSKPDLISAAIAGLLVIAIVLFFKRTKIGLGLRAIADDPAAAQVVGIPLRRVWAVAWALAGMIAIASGVLWGSRIGVHFAMSLIALKALPVLIIGGIDSVAGVIVAGLIIGAAEALGEGYIGTHIGGGVQDVMAYVVALLFLMFKPSGLFGQTQIQRL